MLQFLDAFVPIITAVALMLIPAVIVVSVIIRSATIVQGETIQVIARPGRPSRSVGPGLHFIIPFVETVKTTTRDEKIDIFQNSFCTKDTFEVKISSSLMARAVYRGRPYAMILFGPGGALAPLFPAILRMAVQDAKRDGLAADANKLGLRVTQELNQAAQDWIDSLRPEGAWHHPVSVDVELTIHSITVSDPAPDEAQSTRVEGPADNKHDFLPDAGADKPAWQEDHPPGEPVPADPTGTGTVVRILDGGLYDLIEIDLYEIAVGDTIWSAQSPYEIKVGESVRVLGREGGVLVIEPIDLQGPDEAATTGSAMSTPTTHSEKSHA